MANALYPLYKQGLLSGAGNLDLDNDTVADGPYVSLVDTGVYTYSPLHQFFTSLSGIVGADQRITTPTVIQGTFDGADVVFLSVTGATVEALVVYRRNSGAASTWALVMYYDQVGGGLPITPNGGNITLQWNVSGIFTL